MSAAEGGRLLARYILINIRIFYVVSWYFIKLCCRLDVLQKNRYFLHGNFHDGNFHGIYLFTVYWGGYPQS